MRYKIGGLQAICWIQNRTENNCLPDWQLWHRCCFWFRLCRCSYFFRLNFCRNQLLKARLNFILANNNRSLSSLNVDEDIIMKAKLQQHQEHNKDKWCKVDQVTNCLSLKVGSLKPGAIKIILNSHIRSQKLDILPDNLAFYAKIRSKCGMFYQNTYLWLEPDLNLILHRLFFCVFFSVAESDVQTIE